jgi:hypothetical protein
VHERQEVAGWILEEHHPEIVIFHRAMTSDGLVRENKVLEPESKRLARQNGGLVPVSAAPGDRDVSRERATEGEQDRRACVALPGTMRLRPIHRGGAPARHAHSSLNTFQMAWRLNGRRPARSASLIPFMRA